MVFPPDPSSRKIWNTKKINETIFRLICSLLNKIFVPALLGHNNVYQVGFLPLLTSSQRAPRDSPCRYPMFLILVQIFQLHLVVMNPEIWRFETGSSSFGFSVTANESEKAWGEVLQHSKNNKTLLFIRQHCYKPSVHVQVMYKVKKRGKKLIFNIKNLTHVYSSLETFLVVSCSTLTLEL